MKRRKFIEYGTIGSVSSLVNLMHRPDQSNLLNRTPKLYEWVFLYWMPYDNNLSSFGNSIITMLKSGVVSNNIAVAVQYDLSNSKKLERKIITQNRVASQRLDTGDSANEQVFSDYLNWAKSQFQSKRWVVIFLGHGGALDEISPDENPIPGLKMKTKWMNISRVSKVLNQFNQAINGRIELLFFQNCDKGTIEANYVMKDIANYTLSSQLTLGAPNYYYEKTLKFIGRQPNLHGGQLAEVIMNFETSNMYHSYTVTNNSKLRELSTKLNPLINSILSSDIKAINLKALKHQYYTNLSDRLIDVVLLFKTIAIQSDADTKYLNDFIDYMNRSVIYMFKNDGKLFYEFEINKYKQFCGLGLFLPQSKEELEKYHYLEALNELNLVELYDAIL